MDKNAFTEQEREKLREILRIYLREHELLSPYIKEGMMKESMTAP